MNNTLLIQTASPRPFALGERVIVGVSQVNRERGLETKPGHADAVARQVRGRACFAAKDRVEAIETGKKTVRFKNIYISLMCLI